MSYDLKRVREMPWLISRSQVTAVFGLTSHELAKLENAGVLNRHCTSRKGKFFKTQIMEMLKIPVT